MFNLAQLARHPALAGFFAEVHPFFWPVLLWHLMRVRDRLVAAGCHDGGMVIIHWWGGVDLVYACDPLPNPSGCRSVTLTRKAWDDPCWASTLPAEFCVEARAVIFPRDNGGSGRPRSGLTKGACTLQVIADTS